MMYLPVSEVALLLDISERAVRKKVAQFISRQVLSSHGGRPVWQIELSSLPQDAQDRYWAQQREAEAIAKAKRGGRPSTAQLAARAKAEAEAAEEVAANEEYLTSPGWQRSRVDDKLQLVLATEGMGRKEIEAYLRNHGIQRSVATVYRYRSQYEAAGKNGLMTGYGNRKGDSSIPDDVWDVFLACYKTEGRASLLSAYYEAIGEMGKHYDLTKIKVPHLSSFEYRLKRDETASALYLARYGESAWNKKFGCSINRDYSKMVSGECAVGDHMQLDLMVTMPDGSIVRPWLTAWLDMKSRKMLGWDLHAESPNSDHIFRAFRAMCSNYGLPKCIYIDNGKDYRCKDFAGGRQVDEGATTSLMADLGIDVHYAIPYRAQSKNIERRFRDFHNYFERQLVGYTGTNIVARPEALKRQIKGQKLLTLAECKTLLDDFIVSTFNKLPFGRQAQFAGLCPDEVWQADNPVMRRASAKSLAVFCQRSSKTVTVGRNGVKDPDLKVTYWAEEFVRMKGTKVFLRRDIDNYAEAWVYSEDGALLCLAKLAESVHPLADDEVSKAQLKERIAAQRREMKANRKAASAEPVPAAEKMELLRAGIAAINAQRGMEESSELTTVVDVQRTPLDQRVREMEAIRLEGTNNVPVIPVPEPAPKRKLYLTQTEMKHNL